MSPAATAAKIDLTAVQSQFTSARDVSAPLVVVRTADPAATVTALARVSVTQKDEAAPVVRWDCVRGFEALAHEVGKPPSQPSIALAQALGGKNKLNPVDALMECATKSSDSAAVYFLNGNDYYGDPAFRQALWNLRDPFKKNFRTLVITQHVSTVPSMLEHDVLMIDEPLPTTDQLAAIVIATYASGGLARPSEAELTRVVDAIAGLSAFAAEQAVALSLRRSGIDFTVLRERHHQMITNTKGLSVWTGGDTFDNLGGLGNIKTFGRRFLGGRFRVGGVLWLDEAEKAMAGVRGDLTGISQDYLATMLSYMQDNQVPGILLMGHPGTGKSALAKAFAGEAKVPCIRMDLGAMHGSLVGESQHAIRHALKVATAVSQGRLVVVATCNSVAILPPEFVNRFKWRFFVDLPDADEKAAIWPIHRKHYEIPAKDKQPDDPQWNGREIEQACATAYTLNCSLMEAAETVVPIAQSSAEHIERRRTEAAGRYLSASRPGPYHHNPNEEVTVGGRKIKVRGEAPILAPGSDLKN